MSKEQYNIAYKLLDKHIEEGFGKHIALIDQEATWSYEQLGYFSMLVQAVLQEAKIPIGQRVACILYDGVKSVACFLGLIRGGYVPCNLNPGLNPSSYGAYIKISQIGVIIYDKQLPQMLQDELFKFNLPTLEINQILASNRPKYIPLHFGASDRGAFCLFTSGTTGNPKAVEHRHKDIQITNEHYVKTILNLQKTDTTYTTSRLFFAYGLNSVLYALYHGGRAVLPERKLDLLRTYSYLSNHSVSVFFAVPTVYSLLLKSDCSPKKLTTRLLVSAGEHLSQEVQQLWMSRYGQPILDGIGTTEILSTFISNSENASRANSTGKLVEGFSAKILDDKEQPVQTGEVGLLWIKGETYPDHYLNDLKNTQVSFKTGWFNTNDLFSMDEEGFFFYHGRANDLIKCGGVWIYPHKLEEIISTHPYVEDSLVFGQRQDDGLYRPVAHVIPKLKLSDETAFKEELKMWCKTRLSSWEYPHFIHFVTEIPKTFTGKKKRYFLKEKIFEYS